MLLYSMTQLLTESGFTAPDLHVLNPNHENYTASLFQPHGDIEADTNGLRNADQRLAHNQHSAFLLDAATEKVALVITPEYSMPWKTLEESLRNGVAPEPGSLWVIGCESITLDQLAAFKTSMSSVSSTIYEPLATQQGRFLDPVLYIFKTKPLNGATTPSLVIVVQFKTSPMGDASHFEINGLQTGTRLYCLGNGTTQLRLATIICSDAFALLDNEARQIYDRTLVIHIQLNPQPRQTQYRQYRSRLMQYGGDQTELVCLNWAKDVHERSGGTRKCWHNISGTAWYLRPDKFDREDSTLTANHRKGLYYTWLHDSRCHALFFIYEPAVFKVIASKVAHIGVPASISRRRGPQLQHTRFWDSSALRWIDAVTVDDGFAAIASVSGDAEPDLKALVGVNPFAAERALALAAGRIQTYEWHTLGQLDSCGITYTEVVNRITACHDTDTEASQFRTKRLKNAHRVVTALKTMLPAALADLKVGFKFDWLPQSPHTNIVSPERKRATAIYLGDEHTMESVEEIAAKAADYIGQWEKTEDAIVEARQRLAVWYRNSQGSDAQYGPHRYTEYDQSHTDSPVDIGREE
jgi:hypothetical protein